MSSVSKMGRRAGCLISFVVQFWLSCHHFSALLFSTWPVITQFFRFTYRSLGLNIVYSTPELLPPSFTVTWTHVLEIHCCTPQLFRKTIQQKYSGCVDDTSWDELNLSQFYCMTALELQSPNCWHWGLVATQARSISCSITPHPPVPLTVFRL